MEIRQTQLLQKSTALQRPPQSLDLNPAEPLWDVGQLVIGTGVQPTKSAVRPSRQ